MKLMICLRMGQSWELIPGAELCQEKSSKEAEANLMNKMGMDSSIVWSMKLFTNQFPFQFLYQEYTCLDIKVFSM